MALKVSNKSRHKTVEPVIEILNNIEETSSNSKRNLHYYGYVLLLLLVVILVL